MESIVIAGLPPGQLEVALLVGVVCLAGGAGVFLHKRADLSWFRLFVLCILALIAGPLGGVGVGGVAVLLGDVHPLDRWWTVSSIAVVGGIAGVLGAAILAVVGAIRIVYRARHQGDPLVDDCLP